MEARKDEIRISTDAMIALVVAEVEAREMAALPSLQEMNEAFHPSEQFQKKMDKLFRGIKSKERMQRWKRTLRRTAISIAALVTMFSCVMMPVRAVREAVVTTLIEWHDEFMSVVFSADPSNGRTLSEDVQLKYIPDGFVMNKPVDQNGTSYLAEYGNGSDSFTVLILDLSNQPFIAMDNEYSTYYSIQFDSHDAIWGCRDDGASLLTWHDKDFACNITGTLPLNELIKIAENIEF